jgi:ADP-heptose:LPS heptosyltransferase
MHLVTLAGHLVMSPTQTVPGGVELVAEDVSGAQMIVMANGGLMKPLEARRPFSDKQDWNGKSILFVRFGGFGDLILLTPVLREVKRRWPGARVVVATMAKHYGQVLENLSFVDEIINYPVPVTTAVTFDAWVFFERAVEGNRRAEKIHMTDLFAEITGLSPVKEGFWKKAQTMADYRPAYAVTEEEATWAKVAYPRINSQRRICVQIGTSAACRTYPVQRMQDVVGKLQKRGFEIFLMGAKGEVTGEDSPGIRIIANAGLTFRQSCAVIADCDLVLGSDSALVHVAGALEIPAIGLYGPFPGEIRTKHSPTTIVLQGKGPCAPCFHHVHLRKAFPDQCPTGAKGFCGVLAGIKPDDIVAAVEKRAKKLKLSPA